MVPCGVLRSVPTGSIALGRNDGYSAGQAIARVGRILICRSRRQIVTVSAVGRQQCMCPYIAKDYGDGCLGIRLSRWHPPVNDGAGVGVSTIGLSGLVVSVTVMLPVGYLTLAAVGKPSFAVGVPIKGNWS